MVAVPLETPAGAQAKADAAVESALAQAAITFVPRDVEIVELDQFIAPGTRIEDYQSGELDVRDALQAGINHCASLYAQDGVPRAVRVPAGRYTMATRLNPPSAGGFGVIGAGIDETTFVSGSSITSQFMAQGSIPDPWPGTPYFHDITFRDFTFDATAHPSDTWGSGNMKMFALGHVKRGHFERVRALNTHSTGFGIDYNEDCWYVSCEAIGCGKGQAEFDPEERVGAGSGFGLGAGTNAIESATLINCLARGNGANGIFYEELRRREALHASSGLRIIGCLLEGNNIGISDAGGKGSVITGNLIIDNVTAGFRVGGTQTGFQGGYDGQFVGNTVRGNGVGVQVDAAYSGGYLIADNAIVENIGAGVRVGPRPDVPCAPGRGLIISRNQIRRNGGSGVLLESNLPIAEIEIANNDIRGNDGDGIEATVTLVKPRILENRITGNTGVAIALRGETVPSIAPRIADNDLDVSRGGSMLLEHIVDTVEHIRGNIHNATSAATNAITNPQPASADTGWTGANGARTFSASGGRRDNGGCIKIVASNAGPRVASPAVSVTAGEVWTGSIWAKAPAGRHLRPEVWHGSTVVSGPPIKANGEWQELTYIDVVPDGVTALRIGVGGLWFEQGEEMLVCDACLVKGGDHWGYIAGDLDDCEWNGTPNASTSTLSVPTSSDPTDVPETMFIGADQMSVVLASPTLTNLSRRPAWSFPDGAASAVGAHVCLPEDWERIHIDLLWSGPSSASGDVVWRLDHSAVGDGVEITGNPTPRSTVTAATTSSTYKLTRVRQGIEASPLMILNLAAIRTDSADTSSEAAYAFGLLITRAR